MKTILISAYAVNPYKGSEDGMGWNFVVEAAKSSKVMAITRQNNREAIERFITANTGSLPVKNLHFLYFDFPKFLLFWKKGPLLSLIYFYMWQFSLPFFVRSKKLDFDIAHNLNFHNDWTPSFLWTLGKPMVWGPIGHHPLIPFAYLKKNGMKAVLRDRALWSLKWFFWIFDPFLWICRMKAAHILCMNKASAKKLFGVNKKVSVVPSVAVEMPQNKEVEKNKFVVLIAARMVYLKGFDIAIKAFAQFFHSLNWSEKTQCVFKIVGDGPELPAILQAIKTEKIYEAVEIFRWMDRKDLLRVYSKTSVFLFPSFEGAGMVVAEAMSYGVPVICFNNSGPGELTPPTSGLKVNYGEYKQSVTEFAQKLSDLYNDHDLLVHESAMAKRHFLENHSWNCRGVQLHEIYQSVTDKKSLRLTYSNC